MPDTNSAVYSGISGASQRDHRDRSVVETCKNMGGNMSSCRLSHGTYSRPELKAVLTNQRGDTDSQTLVWVVLGAIFAGIEMIHRY